MFKKVFMVVFSILMLSSASFAVNNVTVIVDGQTVEFDQPPIIENSRTLVPLRAIFEALGAKVDWISETKTAIAQKRFDNISMTIGEKEILKNGEAIEIDVPAQIINGRTLVPVRVIAEAFDSDVDWDREKKIVMIESKQGEYKIQDKYLSCEIIKNGVILLRGQCAYPQIVNDKKSSKIDSINKSLEESAQEYIDSLENDTYKIVKKAYLNSDNKEGFIAYEYVKGFDITYNKSNLVSIVSLSYEFDGNKEFNVSKSSNTYNVDTGKAIQVTDILDCTQSQIKDMVQETFTTAVNEEPDKYNKDAKKKIKEIAKPSFYLTESGVTFYLQPGLIAPVEAGFQEFGLSYIGSEDFYKVNIVEIDKDEK